jgi:adenylate cyclase class IV
MRFSEIETKYNACEISLESFKKACDATNPHRIEAVESYDHYFTKGSQFIRYRQGEPPQLTMKNKTTESNNYSRTEVNLDIARDVNKETVEKFCSMLGFKPNFSIYKHSFIYWYQYFNTVYYVIYEDESKKKELGRSIEIEMSETYPWNNEKEVWDSLLWVEKQLGGQGLLITPQRRMKRSLFEMYRVG